MKKVLYLFFFLLKRTGALKKRFGVNLFRSSYGRLIIAVVCDFNREDPVPAAKTTVNSRKLVNFHLLFIFQLSQQLYHVLKIILARTVHFAFASRQVLISNLPVIRILP